MTRTKNMIELQAAEMAEARNPENPRLHEAVVALRSAVAIEKEDYMRDQLAPPSYDIIHQHCRAAFDADGEVRFPTFTAAEECDLIETPTCIHFYPDADVPSLSLVFAGDRDNGGRLIGTAHVVAADHVVLAINTRRNDLIVHHADSILTAIRLCSETYNGNLHDYERTAPFEIDGIHRLVVTDSDWTS